MEGPGRRLYPVWCGASPQRGELPAHCELALRNPGGDCGRVLRLDVEEDRLNLSRRAAPRRRGHLLALLLPCRVEAGFFPPPKIPPGEPRRAKPPAAPRGGAASAGGKDLRGAPAAARRWAGTDAAPHAPRPSL